MSDEQPDDSAEPIRETGRRTTGSSGKYAGEAGGLEPPRGIAGAATEGLLAVDDDGVVVYANDAVESLVGYRPESVVGTAIEELLPPTYQPDPDRYRRADVLPSWAGDRVYGEGDDGEMVPLQATVHELPADGRLAVALQPAVKPDCLERVDTLSRITDELRNVLRAAVGARSREQLEQEVCERLSDVDPYDFAWIGQPDQGPEKLVPRAMGGDDGGYLDGVKVTISADSGPAYHAAQSGEVVVANEIANDPELGAWAEDAVELGFHSVAAVPLRHDDTAYGLLLVYANRPGAFDQRERAVLAEIGEAVGLGISALERRRALIADSVLEIEFAFSGDHPLLTVTQDGPTLLLEGVVANTAEEYVFYYTVDGGDPESVVEQVTDGVDRTSRGRVVDDGDEPLVEWVTANPTTSMILSEFGGTKVDQTVRDGVAYITAEVPHGTDVRSLHDALEQAAADIDGSVELVAQRTAERATMSSRQFKTRVTDRLTERQLATLRTAYFAGYHDRPRTSSGEAVAETLDVSPSTFHQHHRVGVRKLLAAAFERSQGHRDD